MQTAGMVYDAIRGVSLELSHQGISKERNNQQQGYKFRGIDDCLNALSSLLPKYGLIITPYVETRDCVERQTKSGGSLFYVTVRVRFSFISTIDGSRHDAVLYGEAMDSADKATNKAMSAAYKYCVLLTFCIPTEAEDADSVTHDVVPHGKTSFEKFTAIPNTATTNMAEALKKNIAMTNAAYLANVAPEPIQAPSAGFIWRVGKHKGESIVTIPAGYLEWYIKNGSFQDHVEQANLELDLRNSQVNLMDEPALVEEGA
jgi:hypothetical protein